ncbi:hypothetical protein [Hydrogenophaga sp. PBL-H3]|uniref:hypothetical protein n=1 Tax=Hydrogenophaga sp. PBL-H3 TaxID=434010 RepID=UPI00131FE2A9|nr:hypothetical protein [Hydrogenophaga sp. PBL-H3]QHE75857.1 hypothetical protein F9Z45_07200 [Hydrogenophaga sp. PBL-H3]QHE80282.1 hypothetical protein F9Z44_07200 [Hydrogenophaga sp. PBL-H3]
MRIFTTILDTVTQRLVSDPFHHDPASLSRIRRAMLDLLPNDTSWEDERLRHRLLVAVDPKSLWFMRVELHQRLCRSMGEEAALDSVQALWPLFEDTIEPALLGKRPGRRGSGLRGDTPPRR